MKSLHPASGALPARFRRPRWLVVGAGDVGQRVAQQLGGRLKLIALTSSPAKRAPLAALGFVPLLGNLDDPATLARLAGLASRVLHLAPPPAAGMGDPRSAALAHALCLRQAPQVLVYGSTSGVYGDCGGAFVDETRALAPKSERAQRRVRAEQIWRHFGRSTGARVSILRIPGIYAPDREGGTPRERLLRATPVLAREDDVFTNHIHANDLAAACIAAMWRGKPQRAYNTNDDSQLRMGDYFDLAAELYGLPKPPRLSRAEAAKALSPMLLSFMSESRRLINHRMKQELRVKLAFATPLEGLQTRIKSAA
jgi:nucleoside-diphosphate-sugar epimerase